MENIKLAWQQLNKQQQKNFRPEWVQAISKSTKTWGALPYPDGEDWKYVKFKSLPQMTFDLPISKTRNTWIETDKSYCLDWTNFSDLSAINFTADKCEFSVHSHSWEMDNVNQGKAFEALFVSSQQDSNPFARSLASFLGLGTVIRIPKKLKLAKPIHIRLNIDDYAQGEFFLPYHLFIDMEEQAEAEIFIEYNGTFFSGMVNTKVDIRCASGSQLSVYKKERGGEKSHYLQSVKANIAKDAKVNHFDMTLPGRWTRHDSIFNLNAEGAEARLYGSYLNNSNYFSDHHTEMNHWVGHTQSFEDYRGIVADSARAVFNGKVYIEKKARQSNSEQINKNLMLSKKAEVDTKPELQIYNDDVKAAHGATVGQLDEEQRFYLQSRGYSAEQAGRYLSKAFVFGLLEGVSSNVKGFYENDLLNTINDLKES